jgi:hypothetical protein
MRFKPLREPLSPADQYIADLLKISDEDMRQFNADVYRLAQSQPPAAVTCELGTIATVASIISTGSSIIAGFLRPPQPKKPPEIVTTQNEGETITETDRVIPRPGFDSVQEVAPLQTTIPLICTRRESLPASGDLPAGFYGGVRGNMLVLWSHLESRGGSQMYRGVYLLGVEEIDQIDPKGFAIGNNPVSSFDLGSTIANDSSSRITIYFKRGTGRLAGTDRIFGRTSSNDSGNSENAGGPDVFCVRGDNDAIIPAFSQAITPSTTIPFGVFGLIPNNFGFRINPRLRPTRNFWARPSDDDLIADPEDDPAATISMWKAKRMFSGRSGIVSSTAAGVDMIDVAVGDTFTYRLDNTSDVDTKFRVNASNSDQTEDSEELCGEVGAAVASRQREADNLLNPGEVFKAGSCLAVLEARDPEDGVFISDGDLRPSTDGVPMEYIFRVIRAGKIYLSAPSELNPSETSNTVFPPRITSDINWDWTAVDSGPRYSTATSRPQIFRCAVSDFTIYREAQIIELNIKSAVGTRASGFCNMRDAPTIKNINENAGGESSNEVIEGGTKFDVSIFQSGTISVSIERYSFFRLYYRAEGASTFIALPELYGVRGSNRETQYNYLRLVMPSKSRWQFRIEPITGWEIRSGEATGNLCVLDARVPDIRSIPGTVKVSYSGDAPVARSQPMFAMNRIEPLFDLGLGWTEGGAMTDPWGGVAEAFVYNEITTSAGEGPEHSVAGINIIEPNETPPQYDNFSKVGWNVQSSTEFNQLAQPSAYYYGGTRMRRLLDGTPGPTHLMPDVYLNLLLNSLWGRGQQIKEAQIDFPSFTAAAQWCFDRRYFFDQIIAEPRNIRQWAADTAAAMLLVPSEINGKFYLKPAISFDPVQIKAQFTAGNIQKNTYRRNDKDPEENLPVQISGRWRQERASTNLATPGLFSVQRELLLRESVALDTDPVQPLDVSPFCTSRHHLVDAAKFTTRFRRIVSHAVSFETTYAGLNYDVQPDDHIQLDYETTADPSLANGAVLENGLLLSTRPLDDGSYTAYAWTPGNNAGPQLTTMHVTDDGRTASLPNNSVFALVNPVQAPPIYRVRNITPTPDGRQQFDVIYMPVDPVTRIQEIAKDWNDPGAWIIEE